MTEQLLYGDSFQSNFLSLDSFDSSEAAHHSHAVLLSYPNDLAYDLETFDATASPSSSSEESTPSPSDSAAEDGAWSPADHPWEHEELSSDETSFDGSESGHLTTVTPVKPTAAAAAASTPTTASPASTSSKAAAGTAERSSRPRRSAAAAAAAAVAESSPPPPTRADLKLRVGRIDITEDQLMTLDVDALQRIVGQRLTSADKSAIKQLRRKIKNKRSAATSRLKKREEKEDLEKELQEMRAWNEELTRRNAELSRRNEELRRNNEGLESENTKLRHNGNGVHTNIDFGLYAPTSSASAPSMSLAQAHMSPSFGMGRQATALLFAFLFSFGLFFGSPMMLGASNGESNALRPAGFDGLQGDMMHAPMGEMMPRRLMFMDTDKHNEFIKEMPAILFFDPEIDGEENSNNNTEYVQCMKEAADATECEQLLA